ncbi:MAG: AlwI family type II restriction endonuclease [Chloroflexi bacterium]|nr:AlwI family type II restriction endonuclease [Chloroflexota bacterium]
MSSYISLNSHTQFEQAIVGDLQSALEKRGFSVIHNGTMDSHAPGGKPDIVAFNEDYILIFEVTKSKSAAQDREFQSIRSHLKETKAKNPEKQCYCVFVSPKTSERTFDSVHDHNHQRASEGKSDMKILPLAFNAFELWVVRLIENLEHEYPVTDFISLFEQYGRFADDLHVFKLLVDHVFPSDGEIPAMTMGVGFEQNKKSGGMPLDDLVMLVDQVNQHKVELPEFDVKLRSFFDLFTDRSMRTWNRLAKAGGLSITQVHVLQGLYYEGSCNINYISEFLKITAAAASQLVEQLVKSDLVERTEYPENRRMKQLTLSSKGTMFIKEGIHRQHSWMEEIGQNLSEEELEQVVEMFKILAEAAHQLDEKKQSL